MTPRFLSEVKLNFGIIAAGVSKNPKNVINMSDTHTASMRGKTAVI